MAYDKNDRVTQVQDVYGLTLTSAYDQVSNRTQVSDSLGGIATSVYNVANRLTTREFGGASQTPVRADLAYTSRNQLSTVTRYSDLGATQVVGTTVYGYDNGERVTAITNKNASAATLSYQNYGYDNANRVTTETSASGTATYTYDTTNQLLTDNAATYTYDANGNRNMTGYQTGTGNQVSNDGVYTYTYDNNGNLTQQSKGTGLEAWFYTYDQRNLLTSVRKTSDGTTNLITATYIYDVVGHRIAEDKWVSGVGLTKTRMAYDLGTVWADLTATNTVVMRYLHGEASQQPLARIDGSGNAGWCLQDHFGTVRDVLNASGAVVDTIKYDGYGNVLAGETNAAIGGRFLFQGENEDRDLFTFSADARVDKTTIGRWLQPDPIIFRAGDPNIYRLVQNDPTNAADPTGLEGPGPAVGPAVGPVVVHQADPNPLSRPVSEDPSSRIPMKRQK
jgi:RHS repeat-associated protein